MPDRILQASTCMKTLNYKLTRALAISGIAGIALFWIVLLVAQSITPGYNPVKQSLSDLVLGPYSWLEVIDFILLAFVAIAMGLGLHYSMPGRASLLIAAVLFVLTAVGELIAAAFKVDVVKMPLSTHALIHQVGASIAGVAFPFALLTLWPSLKSEHWKGLADYTLAVAISMLALEIAREVLLSTTLLDPWFGLYEKFLLANSSAWITVMLIRLLRVARHHN